MAGRKVFYSFHFDNDVFRTQQVRHIGVIEGNEPVTANEWETARKTPGGIERWINENMMGKSCVIVLIGSETAMRPWVQHEIVKGWQDRKGLLGIYIHNLKDPRTSKDPPYYGKCSQGINPFSQFGIANAVKCYNPSSEDAYGDISRNIGNLVEEAIIIRAQYR